MKNKLFYKSYDNGKMFWETFLDLEGERNCGRDFYFNTHGTRTA